MSELLAGVHVVLVRPRWANNLGAVARAMKNFGLRRLTLVDSQIGSWNDAYRTATHAQDVLAAAVVAATLAPVVAASTWLVGTGHRPPAGCEVMTPADVAAAARHRGPPTLLFGGEILGLQQAELLRCHTVSCIPVASEQTSLNLAQAVCVYGAAMFAAHGVGTPLAAPASPRHQPAAAAWLQRLEQALAALLEASAWQDASRPRDAIARLMQPFYRAGLSEDEVRDWHHALNKAAQPRR
jgi:TrmH family RNA methyltransferase